jgi:hypothetical protein
LLLFGLGVVLVPPLVLWLAGVAVGFALPRGREAAHAVTIGALIALLLVQVITALPAVLMVVLPIVTAVVVAWLVARFAPVRLWAQILAVLPLVALVLFVTSSDASDAVGGGDLESVDATTGEEIASLVLIILDELPTSSIIDNTGAIDAVRFPNLARFAREATWYRNSTTVSGYTMSAVPTILTGRLPDNSAAVFTNHPDNIFRLAAGSHDLVVAETLTRLCPRSACGDRPRSPQPRQDETAAERDSPPGAELGAMYSEAFDVWVDRLADRRSVTDMLDDFEEPVTSVSLSPPIPFRADEGESQIRWEAAERVIQTTRVNDFIEALRPGQRPIAAVIHMVLPHGPWRHLPDGRVYADPSDASGLLWPAPDDPWVAAVQRQQHVLQASYADTLIGRILDRLEEQGVYGDAAIAIAADHGVSFELRQWHRVFTTASIPKILWVPLLVKAPGQRRGVVDDGNVETIDVLPTLAHLAGLRVPWPIDGVVASSNAVSARGNVKHFYRWKSNFEPEPDSTHRIDAAAGFAGMLADAYPAIHPGDDPVAGLYALSGRGDLYGAAYRPAEEDRSAAPRVDDLDRLLSTPRPVLALSGVLDEDQTDVSHVVAAFDGRIVGVSPITNRGDGPGFVVLLPVETPVDVSNVHLGLVHGNGAKTEITDTGPLQG